VHVLQTTIKKVQVNHYRIPLPVVLSDATHGDISCFGLITVQMEDSAGTQGLGYTYTVGDIGGAAVALAIETDLKPLLLGADPSRIESIWEKMWWRVHYVGRGGLMAFAMAAIDVALWDMKGKRAGEPLWRSLGGHDDRVLAYAGGIDLQFSLDELLEQSRRFRAEGFRAIKMKVGREKGSEDVERVAAMRAELGADFPLMADANMGWSVDRAIAIIREMVESNLKWIEEPTIPDDIEGHYRILREGGLPIATGENFHTIYEFQHFVERGAISYLEPDLATLGGITPWMKVARLAEAANLPVTSHGVHDLHVHLLAAVPNSSVLEVHGFGLDRFIEQPLVLENGYALAPERAGHGVQFDWKGLEPLKISG
jgi:L-alanine-DL-glutamate epimerase-like enolase superfamily enzyme